MNSSKPSSVSTEQTEQVMESLVRDLALKAMSADGVGITTTLEIKAEAISQYPQFNWKQLFISNVLKKMHKEGICAFQYASNYREYFIPKIDKNDTSISIVAPVIEEKIALTKLVSIIKNSNKKFFTITFIKKSNSQERTINGRYEGDTELGHIKLYSIADKGLREIDVHTIKSCSINKKRYKVKTN